MRFEPISYDHAARLINRRPWDVSRDVDLLVAAHNAAIRTYVRSECTVGVDIYNLEIEAYGCKIVEPEGNGLPVAGPPPFDEISDLLSVQLDPVHDGRIPMLLDAATQLAEEHPSVRVRVPIAGPFTIACHLLGMENTLCELAVNSEPLLAVLLHLADNQLTLACRQKTTVGSLLPFEADPQIVSEITEWIEESQQNKD